MESRAAGAAACAVKSLLAFSTAVFLVGCATPPPSGPSVMVLPGSSKSFDQFRYDDYECRQFASSQIGGSTPQDAAVNSGVASAAVGTAVGAAAGGLMGGNAGAGVGAGVGLAAGALAGTGAANSSAYSLQRRYDFGYQQCMYAKGHQIPMAASRYAPRRPAASRNAAPPPPGAPPPPPPGVKPG